MDVQLDERPGEQNQFLEPKFVVAAVVVLVIVILGVVMAVRVGTTDAAAPTPSASSTTPGTAVTANGEASICGLEKPERDSDLTIGPAVVWNYEGTTAYPTSQEFGPTETAPEGYRYCFQQSEEGALLMAANALAQGSSAASSEPWARYVLAEGPYRDQLLSQISARSGSSGEGVRARVVGFRVLHFDGSSARIDLGVQVSSQAQNLSTSAVYELVWKGGDWRISSSVPNPLDTSTVSDFAGFVAWGE